MDKKQLNRIFSRMAYINYRLVETELTELVRHVYKAEYKHLEDLYTKLSAQTE